MPKYTTERFDKIKTQQILCHDKIVAHGSEYA